MISDQERAFSINFVLCIGLLGDSAVCVCDVISVNRILPRRSQ